MGIQAAQIKRHEIKKKTDKLGEREELGMDPGALGDEYDQNIPYLYVKF